MIWTAIALYVLGIGQYAYLFGAWGKRFNLYGIAVVLFSPSCLRRDAACKRSRVQIGISE